MTTQPGKDRQQPSEQIDSSPAPTQGAEHVDCLNEHCTKDFRCPRYLTELPINQYYDSVDIQAVLKALDEMGLKDYNRMTVEQLIASCMVIEQTSPLHGRLIETIQAYIRAKSSAEFTKAISTLNDSTVMRMDSALNVASVALDNLSQALDKIALKISGDITNEITSFIKTVETESKSSSKLTSVIIIISIVSMIVNAWMATCTADMACQTRRSVDLSFQQAIARKLEVQEIESLKSENQRLNNLLTEIKKASSRPSKSPSR
ncbi:MAG: hypothetical protein WC028_02910 [Candidatus Obscuribacterales bacterium]